MRITAIIPARMDASRLPGKPLADIGGTPMVVHAWRAADRHPDIDEALVATDHPDIVHAVEDAGGRAILTGEHPSGTDRCLAACRARRTRRQGVARRRREREKLPNAQRKLQPRPSAR